ncbi:MAG: DNA topoisomerase 3 [Clostridia bacterium]|nr:DNA topoisomerase 3 [Clostridia bacterium]
MKLVICEKPSVAMAVSNVIGAKTRRDGYMEGSGYIVSWCFGHLAELASADTYDERFKKWRYDDLPIVPQKWEYLIKEDKSGQFELLRDLMNRADVTEVINACDAGREGELIFRTVYYLAGCTKTMKRLWISSMEDEAIRKGFDNLRPGSEYDGLYQSALCRAKADWLVGINGTRLFSILYHRKLNVGRVVSPTLSLIVQRECEIDAFKPETFYTVHLDCGGFDASSERITGKTEAEKVLKDCTNQPVTVKSVERKEKSENSPLLYDLTTLQREANRQLGYTAQQTLDYVQALYEKRLCTYPRTDSRYLTEDMTAVLPALTEISAKVIEYDLPTAINTGKICNNVKVSDHHAIVPTVSVKNADVSVLPKGEREILRLIARQLLCAVSEPFRYAETVVTFACGKHEFTAKGKTVLQRGWKSYLEQESGEKILSDFYDGDTISVKEIYIKNGKTTPPKRHTEDTVLSAMETAGKDDMPEDAERKGIGTPATRAAILEKLIAEGFVERKKHGKTTNLIPTHAGISLITVLPEQLQSPLLTAEWEYRLKQIEHGEVSADDFIGDITDMMSDLTKTYQIIKGAEVLFPSGREVIGKCPRCGGNVTESKKGFFCENTECRFGLWRDNKYFAAKHITLTRDHVTKLLSDKQVYMTGLYSQKNGKNYDAWVILDDNGEFVRFRLEFDRDMKR